jgi:hypothetical protein
VLKKNATEIHHFFIIYHYALAQLDSRNFRKEEAMQTNIRKKSRSTFISISTTLLIFTMFSSLAHGQSNPPKKTPENREAPPPKKDGDPERPHREPPPMAYEACKAKKEGAVVEIVTPREGKINATCTTSPKGLFARPERPPHPPEVGRMGAPQTKQKEPPTKKD